MFEWILSLSGPSLYAGLAILLLAGAIGLPIPEDLPLILAGILIQLERCSPLFTIFVCYTAILAGDILIYSAGYWYGPALFRRRMFQSITAQERINIIRAGIERRSLSIIFVARHLFYMRTITFLSCGALRMRFSKFIISDALAALISVPLMIGLGHAASEHYEVVLGWVTTFKFYSLALIPIIALGCWAIYRRWCARAHRERAALESSKPE